MGILAIELKKWGYNVTKETDLYDRGYGDAGVDFFQQRDVFQGNTITNPPYNQINDWIVHSLKVTSNKVYLFCKIQTVETIERYKIFKENPPIFICPFVRRVRCYPNGIEKKYRSAVCYAWFIWDNQVKNKETKVKWLI